MPDLRNLPDGTLTKLIDFSGASVPKHIQITELVNHGSVMIGHYLLKPNPGIVVGTTQYTILLHESEPFEMEWRLPGSDRYEHKRMAPGDIDIHPPDTLIYKRWQESGRRLFIACEQNFVQQILDEVFEQRPIHLKPRIGVRDKMIEGMAVGWREELQARGGGGRIHAEALATAAIVHLFRVYGDGTENIRFAAGGMNGIRLRRVLEYIEEHLSEDISLCTLATTAGFSTHHFGNIFKSETGLAPYHFLIKKRVHRSKELLLGSDMPISQIALEAGFSGQSHFTEHFRRLTGTTPRRFRIDRR